MHSVFGVRGYAGLNRIPCLGSVLPVWTEQNIVVGVRPSKTGYRGCQSELGRMPCLGSAHGI